MIILDVDSKIQHGPFCALVSKERAKFDLNDISKIKNYSDK